MCPDYIRSIPAAVTIMYNYIDGVHLDKVTYKQDTLLTLLRQLATHCGVSMNSAPRRRPASPARSCARWAPGRSGRPAPGDRAHPPGLTPRECEVLRSRSANDRPTPKSPAPCLSRPRPSIITSRPCWPSSASRTARRPLKSSRNLTA